MSRWGPKEASKICSTITTPPSTTAARTRPNSRSASPFPMSNGHHQEMESDLPNIPNSGILSPMAEPYFPYPDEPDFQLIDTIEWATPPNADPTSSSSATTAATMNATIQTSVDDLELAWKPKPDRSGGDDICGCQRPSDPQEMTCNDLSCVLYACQEECRSNCLAGAQCGNRRIQRKEWKQLQVFHAGKKGKGLRVLENVKKGDFVTEYVGRAIQKRYLPTLFRRYAGERKLYIMALDGNIYLDARKKGGIARYINHSCDPNCVVERWKVRGILRAAVIARQDIPAGTELSFDYQWERKRGRAPTKCYCNAATCRGTLEVPRSMEEEALERKLSTHWKRPLINRASKEIINRCIRIFSKETQEYFVADVTAYDESTGKHLVMYRHDLVEEWEDLKQEDWMILDEEAEQFIIRKKVNTFDAANPSGKGSSLLFNDGMSSHPNILFQGSAQMAKNYVYVQTPIKEALIQKHLLERCQRSCRVSITTQQFAKPPLPPDKDDPEQVEKYQALDKSMDGTVWKLTIVGYDIVKAHSILEKNVAYLEKQMVLTGAGNNGINGSSLATTSLSGGDPNAVMGDLTAAAPGNASSTAPAAEVVLPRIIVESVKRRLPILREKSRNVNITFVPSESKSKQFAKLIIEGSLLSDVETARENLWNQLITACEEQGAPKTPSGMYIDLGFLGGALSSSDFNRLLEYCKTTTSSASSTIGESGSGNHINQNSSIQLPTSRRQSAKEDLSKWSPFFASFEATQRCTIWVQADSDKGRIDGTNRIVSEATPNAPRKIYFGCEPKVIPKLWNLIQQRAFEIKRGVKYLYLGPDRLYQPMMMRNSGQFFEFVRDVTGASVTIDSMTGDHLRIDGQGASSSTIHMDPPGIPGQLSESERAVLAEELIRLQIELYRDHCIRQQSWIFGRDWTLARRSTSPSAPPSVNQSASINNGSNSNLGLHEDPSSPLASTNRIISATSRTLSFDSKSLNNASIEMADIVSHLGMSGSVAAHAVVILYRFATVMTSQPEYPNLESAMKMREVELACIFISNKAQKNMKWKKLDAILEAAYKSFYPGVTFDSSKEEVLVWEEKVIAAETELLDSLGHDVFWRGFDWIVAASIEAGKLEPKQAKHALLFSVSGPVLAAGPDLWLTYGGEYIFAAAAGFLDAKLDGLFAALSLIPFKVHQAAEQIVASMKTNHFGKALSKHPNLREGKKGLLKQLPKIKETCAISMGTFVPGYQMDQMSEKEQRYRLLGQQNKLRQTFQGMESTIVKDLIFPRMDGIGAESNCSIFIDKDEQTGLAQITLEGSWRALAIASCLLQEACCSKCHLATVEKSKLKDLAQTSIQAKNHPGLLEMIKIETVDGWAATIQSQLSTTAFWGRKTGGKSCVPGKIREAHLRQGGLRWWIPPRYGPSMTGTICDMFIVNHSQNETLEALASLTQAFQGESPAFSMLTSVLKKRQPSNGSRADRFVAVSLQRWPTEKVAKREQSIEKKEDKSKGKKPRRVWQSGFSAGALQEMQLLLRIHSLIKSPQGHPNFLLPVGIGLPSELEASETLSLTPPGSNAVDLKRIDEDIFSLTRTSLENEVAAEKERKRKDMVTGPHLVFHPTPFVLQRFTVRKKKSVGDKTSQTISPPILAAWIHDLLSALLHCHCNDIILRNFQSDQIMVDHAGVVKFGSFYRATLLSKEDKTVDILAAAKERKKDSRKSRRDDDDEILSNPYAPPEMLLGSPKFTKETDMWTMGCLLCHLLLGKPAYVGKDRQSMLLGAYKLVGTPATENFKEGTKFPYFEKPKKRYAPGVIKALTHMMKDDDANLYSGAIDLISQMLHLDPKKRITAKQAMQHEYIQCYVENCSTTTFHEEYVKSWIALKQQLMSSHKSEEDEIKERERGIKRKAMLLAASKTMGTGDDDLYDMDDILGDGENPSKIQKY